MTNIADDSTEPLVEVRREWNSGGTALYQLDAISGWHWKRVGGGVNTRSTWYIFCAGMCCAMQRSSFTIHKLVAVGIDAPERLLFMSTEEIGRLNGIEPVMRRELEVYRSRFVGD